MNLDSNTYMQINNNTKIKMRIRIDIAPLTLRFPIALLAFHLETKSGFSESMSFPSAFSPPENLGV